MIIPLKTKTLNTVVKFPQLRYEGFLKTSLKHKNNKPKIFLGFKLTSNELTSWLDVFKNNHIKK